LTITAVAAGGVPGRGEWEMILEEERGNWMILRWNVLLCGRLLPPIHVWEGTGRLGEKRIGTVWYWREGVVSMPIC